MSNLPLTPPQNNSDEDVSQFFNRYFTETLSFPSNQVDAVFGFFVDRGFEESAAAAVSTVLLEQAKIDRINIFKLIDTLKGLTPPELSAVVTETLNYRRPKTSSLGYRRPNNFNKIEKRNIEGYSENQNNTEQSNNIDTPSTNNNYVQLRYVQSGYVDDI
jgi:hypothetical protein